MEYTGDFGGVALGSHVKDGLPIFEPLGCQCHPNHFANSSRPRSRKRFAAIKDKRLRSCHERKAMMHESGDRMWSAIGRTIAWNARSYRCPKAAWKKAPERRKVCRTQVTHAHWKTVICISQASQAHPLPQQLQVPQLGLLLLAARPWHLIC